jgi:DtxR family Mn-dependent transcriptional regulator
VEDYLRVIYSLQREGAAGIGTRLRDIFRVSAPTVWATLRRMGRDGLLLPTDRNHIQLSEAGLALAESAVRRHMLAECFLANVLKLDWWQVHRESHLLEHAISPTVEAQLRLILNNPTTCPHGNPIPGMPQAEIDSVPLSTVERGEVVAIVSIEERAEEDDDLLYRLGAVGLLPGAYFSILTRDPATSNLELRRHRDGSLIYITGPDATALRVRREGPSATGQV